MNDELTPSELADLVAAIEAHPPGAVLPASYRLKILVPHVLTVWYQRRRIAEVRRRLEVVPGEPVSWKVIDVGGLLTEAHPQLRAECGATERAMVCWELVASQVDVLQDTYLVAKVKLQVGALVRDVEAHLRVDTSCGVYRLPG